MRSISALTYTFIGSVAGATFFIATGLVLAWTGPTASPPACPSGQPGCDAPLNVGTTDQIKNAVLSVNALAVFGNAILNGASRYLNFGSSAGSSGYGIRDNSGTMEFKNSAGSWQGLLDTSSTFTQIKFADGTTQTTAPSPGGIAAVTTASCLASCSRIGCTGSCVATCPATYSRTGCSSSGGGAQPSGSTGCTCSAGYGSPNNNTCYTYCAK